MFYAAAFSHISKNRCPAATIQRMPRILLRYVTLSQFLSILIVLLCACGSPEDASVSPEHSEAAAAPFTVLSWNASTEEMIAVEGGDYETYPSVYNGTTYTYPKQYLGKDGTVKYMFDQNGALMSAAWAFSSENIGILQDLYNEIEASVNTSFGESGYNADGSNSVGNYGNVWYLEQGDIVLSTMITSEVKALQYAYLHPSVSNTDALGQNRE